MKVNTPMTKETARSLKAGQHCLLSGVIYTARDAAHKRLLEALERGETLPIDLEDAVIYFVGPAPAKPGQVIGSAGPTTSYRMDAYSPTLIRLGQTGMIGKGRRDAGVVAAMKAYGAVYFGAIGGCGALLADCIRECEVIAYPDLGAEAIHRLVVEDFPVVVVMDAEGNNLYETGRKEYLDSISAD